ncbi:transcriptional regulator protein [Arthrobacter sp. Hiyo8]|nr:transcriptional regulator protein [Arthrobacter sp. Hiyo8]
MAQMDPAQVAALFPGPEAFAERHSKGPQSLPALQDLLARARSLGYAWEQDEVTEGFLLWRSPSSTGSAIPWPA